jgi:hypothetical protein
MDTATEHDLNQKAYRQLKETIAKTYPPGRYVAISEGRIVADADNFPELDALLKAMGKDPVHVLVAEAGVEDPEYVDILAEVGRDGNGAF